MKTDTLIRKDYMRIAVCFAMAALGAGSALGGVFSSARPNPEYIKWQKRRHAVPVQNAPASTHPKTRLLATSGDDEVFDPRFTEGVEPSYIDFSYLNSINNRDVMGVADPLPGRHDPRDDYTLTPVRQQDPQDTGIGTCWAQASVGSMETWLAVNGLGQQQFSVKNMVNLIGFDRGANDSRPRGWFGANAINAAAYLLRWAGPVWESDDPYTNRYGILNYSLVSDEFQPQYHVQQMRIVPARTGALDNEALKRAILEFGGLYATMKLYTPYYTYKGNAYLIPYWNTNGAYYCPETGAGHAVTLVGWDDDYPKENFNSDYRPKGNGAFIVKDSYGTEAPRDNGYIYVSYYDTTFAYSESYAFPQLEDTDNYETIYQYDTLGWVDSYVSLSSAYAANIFTAKSDCQLDAVGFYAVVPNEPYTLSVYVGCKAGDPTDGEVKVEQSGVTDSYAGYYTVKLDESVPVRKGQRFSIVMKLTSSKLYPIPVEMAYEDYSSEATASAGQSFVRINPTDSWLDMTEVIHGTANFCCKAYTKSATAAKPTLLSIAVKPEDGKTASIKSGDSVQMKCEAMYSNNSKSNVTDAASWSLTSGRDYATLSPGGLLTARNVAVLEPQTITVQAIYAEDGIVATNKFGFSMAATPPESPMEVSAALGTDSSCVRVSWTAPIGATEYAVYRATANNSKNAQYLENVTVAKYNDTKAIPGIDYWYFIKAKNSSGTSGFSGSANGWRKLAPPDNVTASDSLLDKVALEWSEAAGAKYYRVYRAESIDGAKMPISTWQNATAFDDTTATAGITYYYYVAAAMDASGNRPSDYSIVEDGMKAVPVTVDRLEINGDASITSGGYADYTADAIYTDGHRVANVSPVTWTLSGSGATLSGNRVTAATVTANSNVTLSAAYTEDGKSATGRKEITIAAVKPPTPTGFTITSQSTAGIVLGWQAAAGALSYNIYRDSSPIGSASGMTFTDNTATPGVTCSYSITAVNSAGESAMSGAVSAMIPLSAPMGVKASQDNATAVTISWSAVNGATYYRVARAANAAGAKTELGTWQAATIFADTTATPGTGYVYFVRAATDANATVTSEWSEGVTGKILYEAPTLQTLVIGGPDRIAASGTGAYSCTAVFSDDTKNLVAPVWAISSTAAATIDPSGMVTAKAVSSDTKVTITASYGGMQANRQIVIVAPLEEASATVSDVSVAPRWPFGTKVDIDYTLGTTPAGMRALVTLSGYDNDHRKEMPATTITGNSANQAVLAGRYRLTWDVGADYPGFHAKSFDVNVKAEPYVIPAVRGIQTGETTTRGVALSWDGIENATAYEVWRSTSMSTGNATNVLTVTNATECIDVSATPGTIYFYWLKTVTPYGTGDFSSEFAFGYRQRVSVAVTFDANGGEITGASTGSYMAGDRYDNLPSATRMGYDFAGWWTEASGGAQIITTSVVDENVTTLFAHWTPHTYTIHFDANGGTGTMADMVMTYDVATNLATNSFFKTGYVFVGWAISQSQSIEYENGANVKNLTGTQGDVVMLYAIWHPAAPDEVNASDATSTDFIKITWTPLPEAIAYEIWRQDEDGSNVTNIDRVISSEFDDTSAIPGLFYYYSVKAIFQNSTGEMSMIDCGCRKLQTPSVSASQGESWNQVIITTGALPISNPNGSRIEIWRSDSSSILDAEKIGTVSYSSKYYDTTIIAGKNYYYWAKSYYQTNDVAKSDFSASTIGYSCEISSVYISGASTLTPGGRACYRLMAMCNDGSVREFPGSVSYEFQDRYGIVNFRKEYMTPSYSSLESSGYLWWLTITNTNISTSRAVTLTATSNYKDVSRTVSKSISIKPKPDNFPYSYMVSSSSLVSLIGYSGTNVNITVPSQINGMPIAELADTFSFDKKGITSIALPSSLQIIGGRAFYLCRSLTSISIPSSVTKIGWSAFTGTGLTTITIPESITSIDGSAFDYACRLQSINVDSRNTRYSSSSGVLFNKDMTELIAYPPAKNDTMYNIPNGVTYISSYSSGFHACFNLKSITIPNSLTGIYTGQVFHNCDALSSIQVNDGNSGLCSNDGVLYSKNMDKLIKYPSGKKNTSFIVPPTVGVIDGCAFYCVTNLCQLIIPASVTNCCGIAGCKSLTSIYCFGDYPFRSPLFYIINSNGELYGQQAYGSLFNCSWGNERNIPIYYFPETSNWGTASYLNEWNNPLISLEINGPSTVTSNSANKFIGLGTFASGHAGVGCKVSWMITEGAEYASISADGVVTTGVVNEPHTVKIKATATLGGVTRNVTKTLSVNP